MSEHHHEPVDPNLLEEMGYERTDVNVATLSKSAIVFFVASTAIMAAGVVAMWVLAPRMTFGPPKEKMEDRLRKPAADIPLVQSNATALVDMTEFAQQEAKSATTYGWSDRKTGMVRIPVDEAMKRVLERGLPSKPTSGSTEGLQ